MVVYLSLNTTTSIVIKSKVLPKPAMLEMLPRARSYTIVNTERGYCIDCTDCILQFSTTKGNFPGYCMINTSMHCPSAEDLRGNYNCMFDRSSSHACHTTCGRRVTDLLTVKGYWIFEFAPHDGSLIFESKQKTTYDTDTGPITTSTST